MNGPADVVGPRGSERASEALLQRTLEFAHVGSWRLDLTTGGLSWSDEVYRILGVTRATCQPSAETWWRLVHADDRERVRQAFHAALAGGPGYDVEFRLVRPDGHQRHLRARSEELRDAGGRALVSFGMVQDVTEAKRHEDVLAARVRLLQRPDDEPLEPMLRATLDEAELLTGSSIGFFHFVDPDQQNLSLQTWSSNTLARMCTATGAGRHYPVAAAGVWVDCIRERRAVVHNDYAALPHRHGLPDGHAPIQRELTVPVLRGGSLTAILGVGNKAVDYVDEDIEVVTLLADLAWDIAVRKRERTERLALERRLLQGQKLESLGVLAGGVAHDFNNLLTVILGNLEMAQLELPADSRPQQFLDLATAAARRAADLTDQMLAYSGRGVFVTQPVRVDELIREHAAALAALPTPPQTLRLEIATGAALVKADPGLLRQLLARLVTNAVEALAGRPGEVVLRAEAVTVGEAELRGSVLAERPAPGPFVAIEVTDTGCGMDAATQQRIFDPFFSTKFHGRGLGLPAVLGIVRGHAGAIVVRSEVGRGTTVRVLLPRLAELAPARPAVARTATAPRVRAVLVVDDEPQVLQVAGAFLRHLGWDPVLAKSGDEAVELFRRDPLGFHFLLVDLVMPGRDGVAVCKAAKALRPDVPVVLTSGFAAQDATSRFQGLGLAGFLPKPYRLEDLRELLAGITSAESAAAPGRP